LSREKQKIFKKWEKCCVFPAAFGEKDQETGMKNGKGLWGNKKNISDMGYRRIKILSYNPLRAIIFPKKERLKRSRRYPQGTTK